MKSPVGFLYRIFTWFGKKGFTASRMIQLKRFPKSWMGKRLTMMQLMELDACMHCGNCTSRCSVAVAFEAIRNSNILPSEKIGAIRTLASGKELSPQELRDIQEGVYLCTNCYRCTVVCPAKINLQDLWFTIREILFKRGTRSFLFSPLSPFTVD